MIELEDTHPKRGPFFIVIMFNNCRDVNPSWGAFVPNCGASVALLLDICLRFLDGDTRIQDCHDGIAIPSE